MMVDDRVTIIPGEVLLGRKVKEEKQWKLRPGTTSSLVLASHLQSLFIMKIMIMMIMMMMMMVTMVYTSASQHLKLISLRVFIVMFLPSFTIVFKIFPQISRCLIVSKHAILQSKLKRATIQMNLILSL